LREETMHRECDLDPEDQISKLRPSLLMRMTDMKIPGKENKHALSSEGQTCKIFSFNEKKDI